MTIDHDDEQRYAADETWLGVAPDDRTEPVTLDAEQLRQGCYIEGNVPSLQTTLCRELLAQWAHADYGFCYVHPSEFATLDVLRALPDQRLNDVVWINLRPRNLPDHLDVPYTPRITVDPLDVHVDGRRADALETAPGVGRVGDVLEVLEYHSSAYDWNVGSLLAAVLRMTVKQDHRSLSDVMETLRDADFHDPWMPHMDGLLGDRVAPEWLGEIRRAADWDSDVFRTAQSMLADVVLKGEVVTPLRGETTCPLHERVHDDAIILVTGDMPAADGSWPSGSTWSLATRFLETVMVRRVWEALQIDAQARRADAAGDAGAVYPVVLDDVTRLFAHEPSLFAAVLEHGAADDTALALVCSGRSASAFGDEIQYHISESLATRIVFEEHASPAVAQSLRIDPDVMERAFEPAEQGDVGVAPHCWVKRDADGMLAGVDDLGGFEAFTPLGPPPMHQSWETAIEGTVEDDESITGRVEVGAGSVIEAGAVVRGPVSIGENTTIGGDSYVGPFTSIGDGCTIDGVHIEASVVVGDSEITAERRIIDSLIGREATITPGCPRPSGNTHRRGRTHRDGPAGHWPPSWSFRGVAGRHDRLDDGSLASVNAPVAGLAGAVLLNKASVETGRPFGKRSRTSGRHGDRNSW